MKGRFGSGALTCCLIIFGFFAAYVGSGEPAAAQDRQSASIFIGTCNDPRDEVIALDPLTLREGGILASFTTVGRTISELTADGYAIIVGKHGSPLACGEISGQGSDVYTTLREMNGSNLSGIAWLHEREAQTQVTVFIGEGLTAGATTGTSEVPGGPPEPPAEQTPEPSGTATPQSAVVTKSVISI